MVLPPSQGRDSSWAPLRQEGAREVFRMLKPVAKQKAFCWAPEDLSGLGVRPGQRLKAHRPPNPCFCPGAIFPTLPHAPPGVIPASQSLPGGRKLSNVHVVGRLHSDKGVFKILRTGELLRHIQPLPGPQDSEVQFWVKPKTLLMLVSSWVLLNPFIGLHWMLGISFCKAHHKSSRWRPHRS